jgi:hypothetical protein
VSVNFEDLKRGDPELLVTHTRRVNTSLGNHSEDISQWVTPFSGFDTPCIFNELDIDDEVKLSPSFIYQSQPVSPLKRNKDKILVENRLLSPK